MDFVFSPEQTELLDRLRRLFPAHAPLPETSQRTLDRPLFAALHEGGFLDLARSGRQSGVLDTALVVEEVARSVGIAPVATHSLVLPLMFDRDPGGIATICDVPSRGPFRYAADATILICFEDDTALAYAVAQDQSTPVKTNYVYPYAIPGPITGAPIATASAAAVRRRHRIGMAAECVGAMDALLTQLVGYLSTREQFGRKLGSFQALHHRVAELAVLLEGSRWISREAAWLDEDEAVAFAAAYTTKAARRLCWESHELTGARGFSVDFGMYQHSLRLQALSVEAGSIQAHANDAARMAWGEA
jgi:alkylation response protein AidB-like acyl-CoA dehydrogenase